MIKKVLGAFLIMLFSIVVFLFFRTGAYKGVKIEKVETPKLQLFYVEHIGPYHEIVSSLNKVEEIFKELGSPCTKTFGHFLSNPEMVEHDKLVSHVGCAFIPENSPQLFSLPEGVSEKFFGEKNKSCYKGSFKGSPSLSALKVYPKIKTAAQKDRVKLEDTSLEIYTVDKDSVLTEVYICEE